MRRIGLALFGGLLVCGLFTSKSDALPDFKKAFEEKYVKPANDPQFTKLVKTTNCNVCHVKGEEKTVRNAYGEALEKLVNGNAKQRLDAAKKAGAEAAEKAKLMNEFDAALTKTEADKSAGGVTYGELLKQHKLPE